jgi:hypothetical protein
VEVTGASKPATMVYNSWIRMQAAGRRTPRPASSTTSRS